MYKMFLAAVLVLAATTVHAQEIYYPGSVWSNNGRTRPVEQGNVISMTHVEQGIAYRGLEGFVDGLFTVDTHGLDWNNSRAYGAGARYTQHLAFGWVRVMAGVEHEYRWVSYTSKTGPVISAELWFGWHQTAGRK